MKNILTCSENISHEYCCTVVRIGEIEPIEGSDFLGKTMINGFSTVVRKDAVKEGSIMIYSANETELNEKFLAVNNQYEYGLCELNSNAEEVIRRKKLIEQLRSEDKFEEANELEVANKQCVGFFNKYGRVKMIRLRGCPSFGYIFGIDALINYCPDVANINFEELIDQDFDTVNGELFVKAYMPRIKAYERKQSNSKDRRRNKRIKKFDRMIPGQFSFHYDTQQLNRCMHKIQPDDIVTISLKLHGTSFIISNCKVLCPKYSGLYSKIFNYLPKWLKFTKQTNDVVYSSRNIIQNSHINTATPPSYYASNIYEEYYEHLKNYIPEGYSLYGEIIGYMTGSDKMVQKNYDYGCQVGKNKLMIYRIVSEECGSKYEWNVSEVRQWTDKLINTYPELKDIIHPIDIMYHGTLKELYPDIDIHTHWHERVLEALKNDVEHFGMEKNEPLCKNKVPREGIVLRIDNDITKEAFKLKCVNYLQKESNNIDTTVDIEMMSRYLDEDNQ